MTAIITAINNRQYLEFQYEGYPRKVIPFAYGSHATTHNKVMRGVQVAGGSASGTYDTPKLWTVDEISNVNILDETFEVPGRYQKGDKGIDPIEAEL